MAKLLEIAKIEGNLKKEVEALKQAKAVANTTGNSPKEFKARMKARRVLADASPVAKAAIKAPIWYK